jgi:hypothetical protein
MPDAITPVGTMIQPPDPTRGINTLSGILGVQRQRQQLISETAQAGTAQMQYGQLQAYSDFTKAAMQPDSAYWSGGNFLLDKYRTDATAIAPLMADNIAKQSSSIKESAEASKALFSKGQMFREGAARPFVGVATNRNATETDFNDAVDTARGQSDDPGYQRAITTALNRVNEKGGAWADRAAMFNSLLAGTPMSAPMQQETPTNIIAGTTPTMGTGMGGMQPQTSTTKNAAPGIYTFPNRQLGIMGGPAGTVSQAGPTGAAAGGGAVTPPAAPPPKKPAPTTQTNSFFKKDGSPRTAADDAPGMNEPGSAQEAYTASSSAALAHVNSVREADEQYGSNIAISQAIRSLLKGGTLSGPGTKMWHDTLGAIGAPLGLSNVSNYQELNAWLDNQASRIRTAQHLPGTNEGQATAQAITGSTSYQPEALGVKNDFIQAQVEGQHVYRQGLDKIEGFTGNPSPKSVQAFRQAWVNNFDPRAFELNQAKNDPKAYQAIIDNMGPGEAKAMKLKILNMKRLQVGMQPLAQLP